MCIIDPVYHHHEVDFRMLIIQLNSLGYNRAMMAKALGLKVTTINDWASSAGRAFRPRKMWHGYVLVDYAARFLSDAQLAQCKVYACVPEHWRQAA